MAGHWESVQLILQTHMKMTIGCTKGFHVQKESVDIIEGTPVDCLAPPPLRKARPSGLPLTGEGALGQPGESQDLNRSLTPSSQGKCGGWGEMAAPKRPCTCGACGLLVSRKLSDGPCQPSPCGEGAQHRTFREAVWTGLWPPWRGTAYLLGWKPRLFSMCAWSTSLGKPCSTHPF